MQASTLFGKTDRGLQVLQADRLTLSLQARQLLILIDGQRDVEELSSLLGAEVIERWLPWLRHERFVEELPAATVFQTTRIVMPGSGAAAHATVPSEAPPVAVRAPLKQTVARPNPAPSAAGAPAVKAPSRALPGAIIAFVVAGSAAVVGYKALHREESSDVAHAQVALAPQPVTQAVIEQPPTPAPVAGPSAAPAPPRIGPGSIPSADTPRKSKSGVVAESAQSEPHGQKTEAPPASAGSSNRADVTTPPPPSQQATVALPANEAKAASPLVALGAPATAAAPAPVASAAPATASAVVNTQEGAGAPALASLNTVATGPTAPLAAQVILRPRSRSMPSIPRSARRAGIDRGQVVVLLTIKPDGTVDTVKLVRADPRQLFDSEVERTLKGWTFEPPGQQAQKQFEIDFTP
jgi:TonB family protein